MTTNTIYTALMEARREFAPVTKTNRASVGKYSYTYADLGSVLDAVTPALNAHGLVVTQIIDHELAGDHLAPTLRTALHHPESGTAIGGSAPIVCADMNDPQKVGGAITYMRRYALMALLGLNAEDDDAQHARTPTSLPATTSPEPANVREDMSDAEFDQAVRDALTSRNGGQYQALVRGAGKYTSRWLILIRHADSESALAWIEKAIPDGMKSTLLEDEIAKRRTEITT